MFQSSFFSIKKERLLRNNKYINIFRDVQDTKKNVYSATKLKLFFWKDDSFSVTLKWNKSIKSSLH